MITKYWSNCAPLQKSDNIVSHPNHRQFEVKKYIVNLLIPIVPMTAGWRWFEDIKYIVLKVQQTGKKRQNKT